MTRFTYIGGKQVSAAVHTDVEGRVTRDESKDPTDAPETCFAFGMTFTLGVPLDVTREKFQTQAHFDNAVMRLKNNRFFEWAGDVPIVEDQPALVVHVPPPAPKGKKGKPIPLPVSHVDGEPVE